MSRLAPVRDTISPAMHELGTALVAILGPEAVHKNESLARYTTLRVGGEADLLAVADSVQALRQAVQAAWDHGVPCRVLGGGSNVLVSDDGIRGLVILNQARTITFPHGQGGQTGGSVKAASGASFSTLARQCIARELAGLEWAVGIPGTVGGAVVGNAGAWGGEIASTLVQAAVLEVSGEVVQWPVEQFAYGYRTSILKRRASSDARQPVVLEAEFELQASRREALERRVTEIAAHRKASQPPGATCGSVFKNPPGDYAGRLIEAAGLKGQRRGEAEISPVHANFIVNHGKAMAADVKALIDLARRLVLAQSEVALELEIELLGDWTGNPPVD